MNSITLVQNPIMHQRTKYIELDHHLIRNKYQDGTIEVSYTLLSLYLHQADIFIKSLSPINFIYNRKLTT